MSESEQIERGRQAQEILEHPLVVEFFEAAEKELWEQFKTSPLRDEEGREKIRLLSECMTKFRLALESHVTTGKMVLMEQEQKRSMLDRVTSAITRSWSDAD